MPTPPPTDANPPSLTNTTADFLGTVPLFSGLDRSNLESFGELTRERSYPRGSVILFENDPGDSLFIVRSGRVKVVLIGEDGREVILGVLGVGQHFGERSEEHTSELQSQSNLVCRLLLEKKNRTAAACR